MLPVFIITQKVCKMKNKLKITWNRIKMWILVIRFQKNLISSLNMMYKKIHKGNL